MKNKHLVLLFIVTLLVGLAVRRAPWRDAVFFQTSLLKLDTAEVNQLQIALPGQPMLFLLRGDAGWSAEQGDRNVSVPPEIIRKMLTALADLRTIRIVKTDLADNLGFAATSAIQLSIGHSKDKNESLTIGWESIENTMSATYVRLPRHEGIYLVNNHLRNIFSKTLTDFRSQNIAQFPISGVRSFAVFGKNMDSLLYQKNDSTGQWKSLQSQQICAADRVQTWLETIAGLKNLAFADLFDDSHANENIYAQINLQLDGQAEPLTLTIFQLQQINAPEELPAQRLDRRQLALYVLHSSQNPTNYFALPDTFLLRRLCQPF